MNHTPEFIKEVFQAQKSRLPEQRTEPISNRLERLKKLKHCLETHSKKLKEGLYADLKRPSQEAELTEISTSLAELAFASKNLKKWAKPERVHTPLTLMGSESYLHYEPKGTVLIIAPWNYPVYLLMAPLISALAAGCAVVLKPSELAPHTAQAVDEMISQNFSKEEVAVVQGGIETTQTLLELPWDHIFFTGSTRVGKVIAAAAAKHLTPVTLELGGKSPCLILEDADIGLAAEKIAFGKFVNAGQTCVAPDYVWVHENKAQSFFESLEKRMRSFFKDSDAWEKSESYCRIINTQQFNRLKGLYDNAVSLGAKTVFGGQMEVAQNYIAPTVLTQIPESATIWKEEIFGPLLPVKTFREESEITESIDAQGRPLAFYLFGKNETELNKWLKRIPSGGGCINNSLLHLANPYLPFGGSGDSGYGSCHGFFGFQTFSHVRGILKSSSLGALKLFYPPYTKTKEKWFKRLMPWLE